MYLQDSRDLDYVYLSGAILCFFFCLFLKQVPIFVSCSGKKNFPVKLQNIFVDNETSPNFPLEQRRVDND